MKMTVILAAGTFPAKGSEGERLLRAAKRVVACDAAAHAYHRRFRRWPEIIIGDFDSLKLEGKRCDSRLIRDQDDSINDLAKAIRYCRRRKWNDLVIVGATGFREDHTIGNIYHALEEGIRMVTDYGTFYPVNGEFSFYAPYDTGVSVFVPDPMTIAQSIGLRWPLGNVKFTNPWCATLNRVDSNLPVIIDTDRPAFVFVEHRPEMKRVILSLGSNLETNGCTRERYLALARSDLSMYTFCLDQSEVLETEGVDVPEEYKDLKFLNQLLLVETDLKPRELLKMIHATEERLGRVRTVRNGPRTIDIDIIAYEGVKMKTKSLVLPHPRAKERDFVMKPLKSLGLELK